jgi:hypothetical protein
LSLVEDKKEELNYIFENSLSNKQGTNLLEKENLGDDSNNNIKKDLLERLI